ncbi:MAG TPA: FAD-binding oxidoreductase [Pyrinomonadaceae bacterium]|nr:FAD-binding oxidoreductase [Pyrinomonadaceae bacterium]
MKQTADVVIIGGGIVGASVAFHLAERGCANVLVLERESAPGMGSTGRATGGVRAQFATAINIRMSRYSIEFFTRFEEATGHPCGYEPAGYLFVATSEAHLDYLKQTRERQRAEGLANVELVGADEIARRVPGLRTKDVLGGSFCQTDGFIAPLKVLHGFMARATARGVRLWTEAQVTKIEVAGGRVAGVETSRGRIETRAVVNATGAWAAGTARLAGVEIPVVPLRRQLVSVRPRAPLPAGLPMVIDMSDGFHFRPESRDMMADAGAASPPGALMAWPDDAETPGFKTDFDPAFTEKVFRRARVRAPFLADASVNASRCRAGLYEVTPDHHAIIGESPEVAGLFFANGFSGHGVMHSPATGRLVSELILDGHASLFDLSALGAERFAAGRLLTETSVI